MPIRFHSHWLAVAFGFVAFAMPVVATAETKPSPRPHLFTSEAELKELQRTFAANRAAFDAYLPPLAEKDAEVVPLTRGVTAQRSMIQLARYALAYRVTGEARHLDALRRWLPEVKSYQPPVMKSLGGNEGLTAGHVLLGAAMVYDFLEGAADPQLVGAFRALLQRQAEASYRDLSALRMFPYEQNHLIIPVCGLAVAALAIRDENADAKTWLSFSESILDKSIRALGADGWFFEGITYWNYTMQFPVCYGLALKRVTGRDIFDAPVFRQGIPYLGHMMLPGGDLAFDFADWGPRVEADGKSFQAGYDATWHTLPTRPKLFIPIALERDQGATPFSSDLIAHLASRNRSKTGTNAIDAIFMLLWGVSERAGPAELGTYPHVAPYHYFADHGVVHWRKNWSDSDGVAFAFKAGPPAGHEFAKLLKEFGNWRPSLGHAQPDAGSFILFAGGTFLAGDTGYTGKKETADHNSLLIDGIGQHKGGTAWQTFERKPYDDYNRIATSDVWLNSEIAAATADLTAAYDDALRLKRVERKVVLVAGKYLVVADHLSSEKAHVYEWRWHSDRRAKVRGDSAEIRDTKAGLVIKNLRPIADMQVAPTIVETELYAQKASRPQQRGYHLATTSPKSAEHRFLTAAVVQSNPTESVQIVKRSDAVVTFTSKSETCSAWHQAGDGLVGSYAFTLADQAGRVVSAGFKGNSFEVAGLVVTATTPVSLLLRFDQTGVELISSGESDVEVNLRRGAQEKLLVVGSQPVRIVF